jgi:hypothetical protein
MPFSDKRLQRRLIGGASFMDLQKEMWLIPGNRKRALISIALMTCQQVCCGLCPSVL